jgi:hypothetical protein
MGYPSGAHTKILNHRKILSQQYETIYSSGDGFLACKACGFPYLKQLNPIRCQKTGQSLLFYQAEITADSSP